MFLVILFHVPPYFVLYVGNKINVGWIIKTEGSFVVYAFSDFNPRFRCGLDMTLTSDDIQ